MRLSLLLVVALAKFQSTGFQQFTGRKDATSPWMYIGKFGFAQGEGKWRIKAQMKPYENERASILHTKVEVYLDNDYEDLMGVDPCSRISFAKGGGRSLGIPMNGNWSNELTGKLTQTVRPHVWYFAVTACDNTSRVWTDEPYSINLEFTATQEGGSEASYEDYGLRVLYGMALAGYIAVGLNMRPQLAAHIRSSGSNLHPVLQALVAAISLEGFAYFLKFIDLVQYHRNGVGVPFLQSIALLLDPASQVILMGFMWLLACGYTILAGRDLPDQLHFMLAGGAAFAYVVLVIFDGGTDHHTQWYPHEGLTGYMMVTMRLSALGMGIPLAIRTMASATSIKTKSFLRSFFFLAAFYVLALPICMLIAAIFAPYYRKFVMELFQMAIQGLAVAAISRQVIARGDYYRLSSLGQTVLPSAGKES